MSKDLIVGIDAGTSVIKAVAFSLDGRQLAAAGLPNSYTNLPDGGVEQDIARTWRDTGEVLRLLGERVPDLAARTAAIGVTGQGDGTWLIDRDGEPVGPGWLWLDSRAAGIVEELEQNGVRAALYRLTGCGLTACQQSAHWLWMKRHRPELLERATTGFHCKDWLYFKLTGERATDISEGAYTFGNWRTRAYDPAVLEVLGVPELARLLPPLVDGSQVTAPLTAAAAKACGLIAGTPVSLGFLDVLCTALGGGLYDPARAVAVSIVGSTGMHMRLATSAADVAIGGEASGYTMPFMVPGTWSQMQSNMAATLNIDWAVDLACEAAGLLGHQVERKEALPRLDAAVLDAPAAAALYHPYIHPSGERGPFVDANARAQLTGLSQEVGFLGVLRAVYEGLAMAARDCYATMGHRPDEIRIAGGAARSKALRAILASVVGAPVRRSEREEAGAAGCAMMAAVAIGVFPDMATACKAWVDPLLGEATPPDPALTTVYDRMFPIYRDTHQRMRPVWRDLAAARKALR